MSDEHRPESPNRPSKIPKIEHEEESEEEIEEVVVEKRKGMQQRYLIAVEYVGTKFAGAQRQPNCRTVVGVLEEAFHKFIGQPVSVSSSSRTDSGVHALSNVFHADVERISKRKPGEVLQPHEPAVVKKAMNHFLQNSDDITIVDVRCVPDDFHARYKAQERTYFYRLLSGPQPLSTFERDRAWHVEEDLNLPAMQKACKVLTGCHDFSSFRASGCQAKSPIRTLDELSVTELFPSPYFPSVQDREAQNVVGEQPSAHRGTMTGLPDNSNHLSASSGLDGEANQGFGIRARHRCLVVTARARSFLYHQVRLLVGVLNSVGTGELTISDVERILEAKTVTAARPMAPACGLYLGHVKYDLP